MSFELGKHVPTRAETVSSDGRELRLFLQRGNEPVVRQSGVHVLVIVDVRGSIHRFDGRRCRHLVLLDVALDRMIRRWAKLLVVSLRPLALAVLNHNDRVRRQPLQPLLFKWLRQSRVHAAQLLV